MKCCNVKINIKKEPVKLDIKTNIAVTGKQSYSTIVDLSMPDGDQVIIPNEGKVFSKVTVKKPDTMVPENIRKGTDIGGVVGTMTPAQPDMLQQLVDLTGKLTGLSGNPTVTNYDFLENLDTSKVTSFASMFSGDNLLERVPESWNTSNVTDFGNCFNFFRNMAFSKIPNWDYSKGENVKRFLSSSYNVTDVTMNIPNVSKAEWMFYDSYGFKNVKLTTSSKLTSLLGMFSNCDDLGENITVSNTENVTDVSQMFEYTSGIETIPNFNFKNVTNASNFVRYSTKIKKVPNIFGNKVTSFGYFAYDCRTLEDCELDMLSCTNSGLIFSNCRSLTNLKLHNIKINTAIGSGASYGTKLTKESLIFCIKELWSYKDTTTTRTLTISTPSKTLIADIYVKLITPTQEQIEADPYINDKLPCEVCESIDEGAMTITAYANLKNWTIA